MNHSVETLTGIKFITWTWAVFVKNPGTGRFLFFLAHILAHNGFCISTPGSAQPHLTFFFKWKGTPSDTLFESSLRKECNALFVS
jgi:hypothetical protein